MKQNKEHIQETIDLIKKHKRVNMALYQSKYSYDGTVAVTLEEFHTCNNYACIQGYMALTSSFALEGGYVDRVGDAVIEVGNRKLEGDESCVHHFGIPGLCANFLVYGNASGKYINNWYNWDWEEAVKALEITRDFDFTAEECEEAYFQALDAIYSDGICF